MVSEQDKAIFFPRTFNEQMAWIDEEVELILRSNKRKSNSAVAMINRNEGSGHAIDRLFKIIKEDPKNIAVLREVEAAERELWAFFEHKSDARSEEEIYTYWHNYLLAYIAELELEAADIPYKVLSPEKNGEYKAVKIVLDYVDMFMFKQQMVKQDRYRNYVCDGMPLRKIVDDSIFVQFHVKHTYEIFGMMGELWGNWNGCPDYKIMGNKAQEWQEKYDAELMEISHDTLIFQCRCLSEDEVDALWKDICQIAPNSQDIKENGKKKILESREFTLWWD